MSRPTSVLLIGCSLLLAATTSGHAQRARDTAVAADSTASPADARVWVNTRSRVYHCPGSQYFGKTAQGKYLLASVARQRGYRAAYNRSCSSAGFPVASQRRGVVGDAAGAGATRVWVNTRSHVYHCPGSRYYGNTRYGTYMPEKDAQAAGNRPAYGRAC